MGEVNMLWLDSAFPLNKPATDPGVQRGDCPGGVESTPTYLRQNSPDGWVSFQNAFVGPIGSFLSQPPTPSPGTGGGGCCQFEADWGLWRRWFWLVPPVCVQLCRMHRVLQLERDGSELWWLAVATATDPGTCATDPGTCTTDSVHR